MGNRKSFLQSNTRKKRRKPINPNLIPKPWIKRVLPFHGPKTAATLKKRPPIVKNIFNISYEFQASFP